MEIASYGALFLLAVFVPAYAGDPTIFPVKQGEVAVANPGLAVALGVAGAAGVGALLSLLGGAIWDFFWPYSPTGGWVWLRVEHDHVPKWITWFFQKVLPQSPSEFRSGAADLVPEIAEEADWKRSWGTGHRAVVRTAFLLYGDAPEQVREWIRRRYDRFSQALSADASIGIGLIAGWFAYPTMNGNRAVLSALFVLVGVIAFLTSREARREAIAMETYWFAIRRRPKDDEITHLTFEPKAELTVRPTLRLPFDARGAAAGTVIRGDGGNGRLDR